MAAPSAAEGEASGLDTVHLIELGSHLLELILLHNAADTLHLPRTCRVFRDLDYRSTFNELFRSRWPKLYDHLRWREPQTDPRRCFIETLRGKRRWVCLGLVKNKSTGGYDGSLKFGAAIYCARDETPDVIRYSAHYQTDTPTGTFLFQSLSTQRWARLSINAIHFPADDIVNLEPKAIYQGFECDRLSPGDPIELQWRLRPEFSWSWFFGVVERIDEDSLALWFPHYPDSSQFSRATIDRREMEPKCVEKYGVHGGYVGGVRHLNTEEILSWLDTLPKTFPRNKINMPVTTF